MSISVQAGLTLSFERFWEWLSEHPNCVLRVGTAEAAFYDSDDFHWHFEEDEQHNPVVQLICGKQLVAEMVLDTRDLLFVQVTPDPDGGAESGRFLFELIGGSQAESYPLYHFLMAHGLEEQEVGHIGGLKH